jgi:6-phosphofructokinase
MADVKRLGILVGGGPAPGINSVIAAATIRALLNGVEVVGITDGFQHLMQGDIDQAKLLSIDAVSRIHFRGGSILRTSRANPTVDVKLLDNTVSSLGKLGITKLVTIGGDDTAYSAMKVEERAAGKIRVVHVPKTIDNDLDLPPDIDTFGYQTARHVGAEIVKNIMVDAYTTSRWYFIVSMGRKAGHLALGIGKSAGATLTLISEEFGRTNVPLRAIVDTLVCAIVKRSSLGQSHGVAVLAEGLVEAIKEDDLGDLEGVPRDDHGHLRIAEVDIGEILKRAVQKELRPIGLKTTIVAKDIGYELRSADPVPADMEYTRDLGYCATRYLLAGGHGAMVSMQGGRFVPIAFSDMVDPSTGRTRVRLVDINSTRYAIARRYMIRLRRDDFSDEHQLTNFASKMGLSVADFRRRFEYLVEYEPPPLQL